MFPTKGENDMNPISLYLAKSILDERYEIASRRNQARRARR